MAVLPLIENANKENIPPLCSVQPVTLVSKPPQSCIKRRLRKPLEDITNLLNHKPIRSIQVPQNRIPVYISSSLTCKGKCGKRRAGSYIDSKSKKTHVVFTSKNFR
ncbi:conserved hypothetical protein [Ricinus communis]|uniref:Uncharacterized protein n=1 Tax=Ricinus communis TaxID=3988 RepID=B9S968_RICCO|nr:conserved hypothetical protein [Ricinus communis]